VKVAAEACGSAAPGAGANRRDGREDGGNPRLLGCADERQRVTCQLEQYCHARARSGRRGRLCFWARADRFLKV
jgi:hypothetical protein